MYYSCLLLLLLLLLVVVVEVVVAAVVVAVAVAAVVVVVVAAAGHLQRRRRHSVREGRPMLLAYVSKTKRWVRLHRVRDSKRYTWSPLEDSRLFGPSPWKILATTY